MTRFNLRLAGVALASLITAPALAQSGVASGFEMPAGARVTPMNLNPPGIEGKVYNDGTTEAPMPALRE
jgi:hypothetical protein